MLSLNVLQDVRTIQLTKGYVALIDAADWSEVGSLSWCAFPSSRTCYARRGIFIEKIKGKSRVRQEFLHRTLMGFPKGFEVDHKNGDGLDNRRDNLRIVTRSQNQRNQRRTFGRSRYKGVTGYKHAWVSRIYVKDTRISLGYFPDQESAARAYDAAAVKYYGEFAATNASIYGDY